jgi:hypothetical protein
MSETAAVPWWYRMDCLALRGLDAAGAIWTRSSFVRSSIPQF